MEAGLLRTPITVQRRATGTTSWGDVSTTWVTVCETRAQLKWPTGMSVAAEGVNGNREMSQVACSMRIRYRTGITAAMRVSATVDGDELLFEIKSVQPDIARREYVDLVCVLGVTEP